MSPPSYFWEHRTEIDALVSGSDDAAIAALDDLLAAIGVALAADRTLGGLADWLEWGAAKTSHLAIDGAAGLKGAVVPVTIHYSSADPLG